MCNALELGSDLFKLCFLCRRPPSERAANIGIWEPLLAFQVALSIFTNLFLFSFASDQMALLFPSLYAEEEPLAAAEGRPRDFLQAIAQAVVGAATKQHDHNEFEVKAGMGRVVILLLGSVEHLLVLLFIGLWFALPRYPRWVRLTLARREYEGRTLLSSARAATPVGAVRG